MIDGTHADELVVKTSRDKPKAGPKAGLEVLLQDFESA